MCDTALRRELNDKPVNFLLILALTSLYRAPLEIIFYQEDSDPGLYLRWSKSKHRTMAS